MSGLPQIAILRIHFVHGKERLATAAFLGPSLGPFPSQKMFNDPSRKERNFALFRSATLR